MTNGTLLPYTIDMIKDMTSVRGSITITKQDYLQLTQQAQAYRTLSARMFALPLRDTAEDVVTDFRATNLYTDEFLSDLEDGLRKSSYVEKDGN